MRAREGTGISSELDTMLTTMRGGAPVPTLPVPGWAPTAKKGAKKAPPKSRSRNDSAEYSALNALSQLMGQINVNLYFNFNILMNTSCLIPVRVEMLVQLPVAGLGLAVQLNMPT